MNVHFFLKTQKRHVGKQWHGVGFMSTEAVLNPIPCGCLEKIVAPPQTEARGGPPACNCRHHEQERWTGTRELQMRSPPTTKGKACPQNKGKHSRREAAHFEHWQIPFCRSGCQARNVPISFRHPPSLLPVPAATVSNTGCQDGKSEGSTQVMGTTEGLESPKGMLVLKLSLRISNPAPCLNGFCTSPKSISHVHACTHTQRNYNL